MRIRSDTGSVGGSGSSLHCNHLRLGLNLTLNGYLEKLIGPKLAAELHTVFVFLVVRSCTRTTQPLLFNVPKFLLQLRPVAACGVFLVSHSPLACLVKNSQ